MQPITKANSFFLRKNIIFFAFSICPALLLPPSPTLAQRFCIQNQTELIQALEIASGNSEDDILHIVQGRAFDDVELPSEQGYLIQIKSSFSSDCTDPPEIPQETAEVESRFQEAEELPPPMQSITGPVPPEGVEFRVEMLSAASLSGGGVDTVVLGVPVYDWHHGCGPTAVGMVVGYWDEISCSDLFDGSAATQTSSVDQGMASSGHYDDYSVPIDSNTPEIQPDKSELPSGDEHSSDSIADFMFTSWSSVGNRYGWSWSNHITPSFTDYVNFRNNSYASSTATYYFGNYTPALTWDVLTSEIDAKRPMVFLVDTDGNGRTDHFVTIVGYRLVDGTQYYGCLDTWDTPVRWELFRGLANGAIWGIWGGYTFQLTCPTKQPSRWPVSLPLLLLNKDN